MQSARVPPATGHRPPRALDRPSPCHGSTISRRQSGDISQTSAVLLGCRHERFRSSLKQPCNPSKAAISRHRLPDWYCEEETLDGQGNSRARTRGNTRSRRRRAAAWTVSSAKRLFPTSSIGSIGLARLAEYSPCASQPAWNCRRPQPRPHMAFPHRSTSHAAMGPLKLSRGRSRSVGR